ncbi:MAG TPA: hypothetical protein VLG47_04420 [Candidatus Saccharimonadales bacterium]|nr:hypothetical protein [Candidatus Saccharimonadales bacterium]
MTASYTGESNRYEATLLQSPNSEWPWGGMEYVGALVLLGDNAGILKRPSEKYNLQPKESQMRIRLGAFLLASVGLTNGEIHDRLHISESYANEQIGFVREILDVRQRHMMFAKAVGHLDVLNISSYGPVSNLPASVQNLITFGLLAQVPRKFVAAAYRLKVSTVGANLTHLCDELNVNNTAGGIAAAIVTHQLGAKTCIPLVHSENAPAGFEPVVPLPDWKALIGSTKQEDFVRRYDALKLASIK